MQERYGQCHGATVVLHGGAGSWDVRPAGDLERATAALRAIAQEAVLHLRAGSDPLDVVVDCLRAMELDPQFNAGRGSTLQADGKIRLTAALMDGTRTSFSGVIGATDVLHPIMLARRLQSEASRVLTSPGADLLARELGLPVANLTTPARLKAWLARQETGCDTVGCVVRTAAGQLFAGTSTGGRGGETPGRVSDSATVAGTYCSPFAGVSATGTGEQIVDDAVAARLETRRRDGMSLEEASRRCFAEALERQRAYGWIALDRDGYWAVTHTTPAMASVVVSEAGEASAFP